MGSSSGSAPPSTGSAGPPGLEAPLSQPPASRLTTTALLAALGGSLGGEGALGEEDESSWGLSQPEFVRLAARAKLGHSPSARSLVNASDLVVALSLSAPFLVGPSDPPPPATDRLREKVLARATGILGSPESVARRRSGAPLPPTEVACEVIGRVHEELADEVARQKLIDSLSAAGGPGFESTNEVLAKFLERVGPFMDFEVVLVSIVRGDKTFHRVHRGFPASYGNVDIIPRAASYCTHTVSADEPLIVHDGSAEAFFRRGVMVSKMFANAYLGIPIRAGVAKDPSTITLGALCAIGTRPRTIGPCEVGFFSLLASEVEAMVLGDQEKLDEIRREGIYRAGFFERLLEAERIRFGERCSLADESLSASRAQKGRDAVPFLAILDRAALKALGPVPLMVGELAGDDARVGVLAPHAEAKAELEKKLPGVQFFAATDVGSLTEWLSLAASGTTGKA